MELPDYDVNALVDQSILDSNLNNPFKEAYAQQSWLSRFNFEWLTQFIEFANYKTLEQEDIISIKQNEKSEYLSALIYHYLQQKKQINPFQFILILLKAFKADWAMLIFVRLAQTLVSLYNPILVNEMLMMFDEHRIDWVRYIKMISLFIIWLIANYTLMVIQEFYEIFFQSKIQVSLTALIFNKVLKCTYPLLPTSEITNFIQIDALQINYLALYGITCLLIPFQVIGGIYVYFSLIGNAAIIGVIGVTINGIVTFIYGHKYKKLQENIMKSRDTRVNGIEELLTGINTIKQNNYSQFFYERIKQRRIIEMNNIQTQAYFRFVMTCIFETLPVGVLFFTFQLYDIFSLKNILLINQSYNQISNPFNKLPSALSKTLLAFTSIQRVLRFLNHSEVQFSYAKDITMIESSFTWNSSEDSFSSNYANSLDSFSQKRCIEPSLTGLLNKKQETFCLKSLKLRIPQGQKVLILGKNASGKTSFLYSIIGELNSSQQVYCPPSISLATQEPWILQNTIKNNIIMGSQYDHQRFQMILELTQLTQDLQALPAGYNSDIGERGQTLSGGQRKRVHLARALYLEKDIYLLDYPCSALDQATTYKIAQGLQEKLNNSTLIVTANSVEHWEFVDRIFYLIDGQIVFDGGYEQFKDSEFYYNQQQEDLDIINVKEDKSVEFKQQEKATKCLINDEDRMTGMVKWDVIKQIYKMYGGKRVFIIGGLIQLIVMSLSLFYSLSLVQIQKNIDQEDEVQYFLWIYPTCAITGSVLTLICSIYLTKHGVKASKNLHNQITQNLLQASVQYFYNVILGSRIKNRLTNDIYYFDMFTPLSISFIFQFGFAFLARTLAYLALGSLGSYPIIVLYLYLQWRFTKKFLKAELEVNRLQSISKSPVLNMLQETVQGILFVRHCENLESKIQAFYTLLDKLQQNSICLAALQGWYLQRQLCNMFFIYISIVSLNYLDTRLDKTAATVSLYLALEVGESFRTMMTTIQEFYSSTIHLERCLFLCYDIPKEQEYYNSFTTKLEFEQNALTLQNVSIKYRNDFDYVIHNLSLQLKLNQKLAIIGRTGCGKTCLTQAITKLIDHSQGEIYYFGKEANSLSQIRSLFSVIPQDPFTFEGTLMQNLDPTNSLNEDQVKMVFREYGLMNINLFHDLHYYIEPNGMNLSLGEKQLIAICRMLLQDRKIIILDECTGTLDQQYALQINDVLKQYLQNKSVIGITHKLDQLDIFDEILLLNQGKIEGQGKKQDILKLFFNQS